MRNSVLFLLLASAAVPAFAADENDERAERRQAARAERAERADAGPDPQSERAPRFQRLEPPIEVRSIERSESDRSGGGAIQQKEAVRQRVMERRPQRTVEIEAPRLVLEQGREMLDKRAPARRGPRMVEVESDRPALEQRNGTDSVRNWRRVERESASRGSPALIEQRTDNGWEPLRKRREQGVESVSPREAPVVSRVPREGTQPPLRTMAQRPGVTANHWRGDWRSDHRYDWRSHRRRHRWLFHFGIYHDPFGWSYRPYSIGWRLWPNYYRSGYWLNDPWAHRLPYAPAGYRWIRYYDDALLVDTWDGRVVDVIRNFFW